VKKEFLQKDITKSKIRGLVKKALEEDKVHNDITTLALIRPDIKANFKIVFKEEGVLCGIDFARETFLIMDNRIIFKKFKNDGESIEKGMSVAEIYGRTQSILSAERTALNFVSHLSGIATLTREFTEIVKFSKIHITDTRKTLPLLREVEKYAVRVGGGVSHRRNLAQFFLIKDNHLNILKREEKLKNEIGFAINRAKQKNKGRKKIEIEVKNLNALRKALKSKPDIIMLDNMNIKDIKKALLWRKKLNPSVKIEVSGRMSVSKVKKLSTLDIDYISIGMLTHSARSIDVSLEIT
jgi:nicotinate-nucleotide pyrophosphorylase (carboxylating)